ncbi:hypothetical protein AC579_8748 [Pseudocercospora musae]|uniref:Protein kinase domain-containing protein n=1 Tax=Pseudocercospora musae TaxID=113226 RepID=A0A139IWH2_9PEZI|nr:hypothetical protein AC579_8748 [Pseudocercospora musae]
MSAVAHPGRPRRRSPLSGFAPNGFSADAPMMQRIGIDDDSDTDGEPPPQLKFSKATQALLAEAGIASPPKQEQVQGAPRFNRSTSAGTAGLDTPSRAPGLKVVRRSPPGNTPPRVVHLGTKGSSATKRSISIAGPYPQRGAKREPTPETQFKQEVITPAQPRAIRVVTRSRSRAGSNASQSQDDQPNSGSSISRPTSRAGSRAAAPSTNERRNHGTDLSRSTSAQQPPETASRYGNTTRTRNTSAEPAVAPGSQRVKRPPGVPGSFLRNGPVRRGFKRQDSEENFHANDDAPHGSSSQQSASSYTPQERSLSQLDGARSRSGSVNTRATSVEPVSVQDFAARNYASQDSRPASRQANGHFSRSQVGHDSRPPSRQTSREASRSRQPSVERRQPSRRPSMQQIDLMQQEHQKYQSADHSQSKATLDQKPAHRPALGRGTYRYVASNVHTDAADDQENVPPPTFKRNKDQDFKYLGKPSVSMMSDDEKPGRRLIDETPVPVPAQEQRKALGAISGNTPHRPAPAPPPKMSVLDAATATAGATTAKSRKKRQHIVVKGKLFTQMGEIGKGGSCRVYCVMAENYKTFALKRVKLGNCDENTVRGFKGEIDLLKKLTDVERVVRLYDWEMNEEKQELAVLMEKGDTDFNRVLALHLNGACARFDSVFTRYHWKEMLECVQAVHDYDIVHSDLKPANFLLVQGRLKLIDFGIANAIDTDHTCNVHRDFNVGTPNYMSPESITDANAGAGTDENGRPLMKDIRIGKSSDVWSLGCILYQMAYGRPPFAHIQNPIPRVVAITNPKHIIEYPETGIGGATIPYSLKSTLRSCLNRDPQKRPTVKELLSDTDSFLYPDNIGDQVLMDEHLLKQIINKVVARCRERGIPADDEVDGYPRSFIARIKQMRETR